MSNSVSHRGAPPHTFSLAAWKKNFFPSFLLSSNFPLSSNQRYPRPPPLYWLLIPSQAYFYAHFLPSLSFSFDDENHLSNNIFLLSNKKSNDRNFISLPFADFPIFYLFNFLPARSTEETFALLSSGTRGKEGEKWEIFFIVLILLNFLYSKKNETKLSLNLSSGCIVDENILQLHFYCCNSRF